MNQKTIQNEIMNYLKNEGFTPSIDDDGDINFKKEGDLHYVIIDEKEENPFYLTISLTRRMEEGYDMEKAISVAFDVEGYKGIKIKLYKTSIVAQAQMFFQHPDHFKQVFYRTTQIMLWAMDEFCEKYF